MYLLKLYHYTERYHQFVQNVNSILVVSSILVILLANTAKILTHLKHFNLFSGSQRGVARMLEPLNLAPHDFTTWSTKLILLQNLEF